MKVLIIDDNPLDIELVSRMLHKRLGAEVESVHTGEEGLRRLQVEVFDVVLLDYCLPGLNGLDFLRKLRGYEIEVPVLLVTARGDPKLQEHAREAGAVDYISKDESMTPSLYRAVIAAAEKGRAEQAIRERDRAERLRRDAEKIIAKLEQRVEHLESSLGSSDTGSFERSPAPMDADQREDALAALDVKYRQVLKLWLGTPSQAHEAREILGGMIAEMFKLRLSAEKLVGLHTSACHSIREHPWKRYGARKACSPRMLLIEASLALLDAYRRAY